MRPWKCKRRGKVTSRCVLIGVVGTGSGVGVTHLALSIANFFSSALGARCAYAELCAESKVMSYLPDDTVIAGSNVGYRYKGVDYYPAVSRDSLSFIRNNLYDIVICDLGKASYEDWIVTNRCDRLMIIGSMQPWRFDEYRRFMRDFYITNGTLNGGLYGLYLKKNEKFRFEKEFGVSVDGIPFISDPYGLNKTDIEYLQKLTAGWL